MRLDTCGRAAVAALVLAAALLWTVGTGTASAAPLPSRYGAWTFTGSSTAYTGTVDLGTGFPAVSMTSDSRTPPGAGANNPAGAISTSAVIRADSAFGSTYGSSQGAQYVNLRPKADGNAQSTGTPSTTTYTFASATPAGSWGVVLGDIDAETLTVTATDADGNTVSGADLGAAAFNYCGTPANATCAAGLATPNPVVLTTADSVTAEDPLCPPTDCNTSGAALSIQPAVGLRTLTVTSSWRQGFPSYQTWFATQTATITGQVSTPCALPSPPTVRLLDAGGTPVATTPLGADGSYSFAGVAASGDYRVDLDPASLPAGASAPSVAVGAASGDTTAPSIAVTTTTTVSGSVTAGDGASANDLPVALNANGRSVGSTTTGTDGAYSITGVAPGDYDVAVTAAGDDTVDPASRAVTVGCDALTVPAFAVTAPVTTPPSTGPPTSPPVTSPSGSPSQPSGGASGAAAGGGGSLAASSGAGGALASTGSPVRLPVLIALLLLGAGLLLLGGSVLTRRTGRHGR